MASLWGLCGGGGVGWGGDTGTPDTRAHWEIDTASGSAVTDEYPGICRCKVRISKEHGEPTWATS